MQVSCVLVALLLGVAVASPTPSKQLLYKKPGDVANSGLGIYKGKGTTIEKHPYLVSIQYYGSLLCAGSIIADNYVLTTGDCIYGADAGDLTIIAGTEDGSSGGKTYKVTDVIPHPSYGSVQFDYDYGLLKIKGKFKWSTKVKSVNLPKKKAKAGSKGVVVGWGPSSEEGSNSNLLQGKMEFISAKDCETIYADFGLAFTDRMICTYNKGKVTPCSGDWADPTTERNVVHALFSGIATSGECSKDAYPAIGANVHTAVPWIKNVTGLAFD